jgi:hypothetical protein
LNPNDFTIPIAIEERDGLRREGEAVRVGIPMPRALVHDLRTLMVTDSAGKVVPHQTAPLAFWSDGSIKWVLLDALAQVGPRERTALFVRSGAVAVSRAPTASGLRVIAHDGRVEIDTGCARFEILRNSPGPLTSVVLGAVNVLDDSGLRVRLAGRNNEAYEPAAERLVVEEEGPSRATVVMEGWFRGAPGVVPLRFKSSTVFIAGSASVRLDFQVCNTQAAVHPGGLWDLGDPGSWLFKDLTLSLCPRGPAQALRWHAETPAYPREQPAGRWSLYQDSSGGDNWDSPNHLDRESKSTVAFRGYRVSSGAAAQETVIASGHRATPAVTIVGTDAWIAAGTKDFWQNFPKALRWQDGALSVGLFPSESRSLFELQAGEQKRHTVFLDFGTPSQRPCIAELQRPVEVAVDPAWIETSRAITWFAAPSPDDDVRYAEYVQQIIEGPHSFFAKREIIDEYGWRNFGDLYADHEAVHHSGPQPFISHYNNQYDFIYGAFTQFQRSGEARWRQLMQDAARHVIDIDIYHTKADKAAFNGGLFWHTDHYKPAATCTHRTYSRSNRGSGGYGGGPSNEHNYTSGLLYYFYLTGDPEAAQAVRELADWVDGMDDGSRTLFGLIDAGPTGGASKTLDTGYHHPGRGAGNSINALLDAYALTRERRYMAKAEELMQRCIHPADDIASLRLDEPEHRWSYLVFLQVVGKYLAMKAEIGETDYTFHYARASLLHYAAWMAENEVPFKDVLHKVELPTETWPAHDVRKSHVLHVAAGYATGAQRVRFEERATFFFGRCLDDLLGFSTAHFTRPLVILCVYGSINDYVRKYGVPALEYPAHNHAFGSPVVFIPQRARLRSSIAFKLRVLAAEIARVFRDKLYSLKLRTRRPG